VSSGGEQEDYYKVVKQNYEGWGGLQNAIQRKSSDDHNHFQDILKPDIFINVKVETLCCLQTTALFICKIHYF
jgi:hypothetical protein